MKLEIDLKYCMAFRDSPDAGMPKCICSECLKPIPEKECPIRIFIDEGKGGEYRFHIHCFERIAKPKDL